MIKAILLDLDDTLVQTNTEPFFEAYLHALAHHCTELEAPPDFLRHLMQDFAAMLSETAPTSTLNERLLGRLSARYGRPVDELQSLFDRFYAERYPELVARIGVQPESARLLELLQRRTNCVVVATNPGLPLTAIQQRMAGGRVPLDYPFALVTSLESMHFGKPDPHYYAEIACHRDADSGTTLMVGNDWEADILPAQRAGMHTFWVSENGTLPPEPTLITGWGTYADFVARVESGWLDQIPARAESIESQLIRLLAFPAAADSLCRQNSNRVLEFRPGPEEWSVRDIFCHLHDASRMDDRRMLESILAEDNPFVQPNYSPWSQADAYRAIPVRQALEEFAEDRVDLVAWLRMLPPESWSRPARHPIFGPTSFAEMVSFIVSHDRAHWRQMQQAVEVAIPLCRED